MNLKAILLGAALASACASTFALHVEEGNVPQIDSLLVRNPCGLDASTASGSPVLGCLNDDHARLVNLTSDESLEIAGGQATLDSTDGNFSRLTVSLVADTLGTAILNIDSLVNGFVTFTDAAGTSDFFALDRNGNNFFTVTGIVGGALSFITYNGSKVEADVVADVKQIRLGAIAPIPEPETYALMMAGLAALGLISRRRKSKA